MRLKLGVFDGIARELRGESPYLSWWARYALAFVATVAATALRLVIAPLDAGYAFQTFYPAIFLAALTLGAGPGLLTTATSALAAAYFFLPPYGSLPVTLAQWTPIFIFLAFGVVTCGFVNWLHQSIAAILLSQASSEARLKESQSIAHVGSWELDHASGRLLWSDETYRIYGVDVDGEALTVEKFFAALHPDDREPDRVAFERAVASREPHDVTHRVVLPGGAVRRVHIRGRCHYSADGVPVRSVGTAQDVTEREALKERLQERLRVSETDFRELATAANVGIFVTDAVGRCTYTNPRWNEIAGLPEGAALGDGWKAVIPDEHRRTLDMLWVETVRHQTATVELIWSRAADGEVRWYRVRGVALPGTDPQRNRFLATIEDVTELRVSYDRIRSLAQRLESVREEERHAIALVLHEGIAQDLFAAQLSLKHLLGQAQGRSGVRQAYDELHAALTKCMVATRQVANDLRPACLAHLRLVNALKAHASLFGSTSGLKVDVKEAADFPQLDEATRLLYFRAAQEALTNVARHAHATQVVIQLRAADGRVIMDVSDDGIGIDESSTKKPGSLGLLGIRERFGAAGGGLLVSRNARGGTTISAHTPLPMAGVLGAI